MLGLPRTGFLASTKPPNSQAAEGVNRMETGLFEIQAEHLREYRQNRQLLLDSGDGIHALSQPDSVGAHVSAHTNGPAAGRCFLRLANLPNFALDRLSRYEATL
jgi:hypothetical protein